MRSLAPALIALSFSLAPAAHAEPQKPETPDQKALYSLGVRIAKDFKTLGISPEELEFLKLGMDDSFAGKASVDPKDTASVQNIQRFQRERFQAAINREKEESGKFLAEAAKKKGAEKSDSGLIYVSQKGGKGESPTKADTVKVTYEGTLRDGTVFDSRTDPKNPISFPLGNVIPCWQEAIAKLKPGGSAEFYCPSDIAYGDNGSAPVIPPGAALKFEVTLLEVAKADAKTEKDGE